MSSGYSPCLLGKVISNVKESFLLNLITIAIIANSFFIFSAFLMIFNNLNGILKKVGEEKIQINVYLEEGLSEEEVSGIRQQLSNLAAAESVLFISQEDALVHLKEIFRGKEKILEELEVNPLPSSFEVRLKNDLSNIQEMEHLVKKVSQINGVDDISYGQEWVEKFSKFVGMIKCTGIVLGGLLLLTIIFIISNTIRLAIHSRQEEIEIMKLVGATDYFIKMPFIIEGGLQGLSGTLISLGTLFLLYRFFITRAATFFGINFNIFSISFLSFEVTGGIVIGGILLGIFGSLVSVERFLKV